MMYNADTYPSPLGLITLESDGTNLTGLWLPGHNHTRNKGDPSFSAFAPLVRNTGNRGTAPVFLAVKRWLDRYFAGGRPGPEELPLAPPGTAFRLRVWALLREIPYGQTTTYGALAGRLAGEPGAGRTSSRAVGGAVGRNPISIIIPCHRVIGANGSLTGYAGGLAAKLALLKLEGAAW